MAIICKNPSCGADNPDDAKVCSKCGQILYNVPKSPAAPKEDNSEKWWAVIVIILIIGAIIIWGWTRYTIMALVVGGGNALRTLFKD
jgi:hypothetical protein